jgi:hypothetical protein
MLSVLRIVLETAAKTRIKGGKNTSETGDKNRTKNQFSPLRHFTEHLADVFRKPPRESD